MKDIEQVIWRYQAAGAEAAKVQADAKAEAIAHLEEAQAGIIAGKETTGSPLYDGLVVIYGARLLDNSGIVEKYKRVANQLVGKTGEPTVMIRRQLRTEGCTGMGSNGYQVLDTLTVLGVIKEDNLIFNYDQPSCGIFVSRNASDIGTHGKQVTTAPSAFLELTSSSGLGWDLANELDEKTEPTTKESLFGHDGSPIIKLTLAIGHSGIADWLSTTEQEFETCGEFMNVRKLCEAIGIDPVPPQTHYQHVVAEGIVKPSLHPTPDEYGLLSS